MNRTRHGNATGNRGGTADGRIERHLLAAVTWFYADYHLYHNAAKVVTGLSEMYQSRKLHYILKFSKPFCKERKGVLKRETGVHTG